MITLGFVAALRRSELVKLRWSDIEFRTNALRVRLRQPKWRTGDAHVTVAAINASGVVFLRSMPRARPPGRPSPRDTSPRLA